MLKTSINVSISKDSMANSLALSFKKLSLNSSNSSNSLSSRPPTDENYTLTIICPLKAPFSIELPKKSTLRDLHIEVSARLSFSRSIFKLATKTSKNIPDNLTFFSEFGLKNGDKVYLNVNIQSGFKFNLAKCSPARKAVRRHVLAMTPEQVRDFFEAKHVIAIQVPYGGGIGTLSFHLEEPLSQDPAFYHGNLLRMFHVGQTRLLHSILMLDEGSFKGKYNGDLNAADFTSKGVPAKTVDTLITILEGFLKTVHKL